MRFSFCTVSFLILSKFVVHAQYQGCSSAGQCEYSGCPQWSGPAYASDWGCNGVAYYTNVGGTYKYGYYSTGWQGGLPQLNICYYKAAVGTPYIRGAATQCPQNCPDSCPVGQYGAPSLYSCACGACAAGSYCTGTKEKTMCPTGTYNPNTGSSLPSACLKCGVGTFNPNTGSNSTSACTPCPAGTYSDVQGAAACIPCPGNTYNSNTGATVCTSCNMGTYSKEIGASSSTVCQTCPSG